MKKTSSFNCTQQELYLAVALAWALCRKNSSRFSKLKGFYTEGYFSCEGYADVVFDEFEVKTGVYNTLNVEMEVVDVGELVAA